MIGQGRNRRGRDNRCGLLHPVHHAIHCTCNVLPNCSAYRHAGHHCCRVKPSPTAAKVDTASAVSADLPKRVCSGNTDLGLLLNLKGTKVCGLRLLMYCILTFFALNPKSFRIIACLCLNSCCCNIFRDRC